MNNEKILNVLRMLLDTNSYILCGTKITVFPTEFVIDLYNHLQKKQGEVGMRLIDANALIRALLKDCNNDQTKELPVWIENQIDAQPTISD